MTPFAMDFLPAIRATCAGRSPALFFDYDGTLTPLVDRPEQAHLSPLMRTRLARLAERCPVIVVSGRDRKQVCDFVGLETVTYAGSHGFDICGPGGVRLERGGAFLPALRQAEAELKAQIATIPGALLESKRYAFALHYRLVDAAARPPLKEVVEALGSRYPRLRIRGGKMVYEFLPRLEWDKGRAVCWLLEKLGLADTTVLPFYFGDDLTDEDAFRALQGRGLGLRVVEEEQAAPTAAAYLLRGVVELQDFLDAMDDLLHPPPCP